MMVQSDFVATQRMIVVFIFPCTGTSNLNKVTLHGVRVFLKGGCRGEKSISAISTEYGVCARDIWKCVSLYIRFIGSERDMAY